MYCIMRNILHVGNIRAYFFSLLQLLFQAYMVMWIVDRQLPRGPFFALIAAPGLLFLGAWMITRLNSYQSGV